MTVISDFVTDLGRIEALEDVPINAVVAQVSPGGEAVAVHVNDGFADLAFGGSKVFTEHSIQIDIYTSQYTRLIAIKEAIIDQYHGKGLTLSDTTFQAMRVTFSSESASTLNNTVYRSVVIIEAIT